MQRGIRSPFFKLRTDPTALVQLFDVAVAADEENGLSYAKVEIAAGKLRDNRFAYGLLRLIVVEHMYLFEVSYNLKQRLCALLDIEYRQVKDRARLPNLKAAP